ncbi:hypothetical protein T484DRAFT_1843858 [Baffinella frigidus]|nr:hypothetical protein T484DRAFT_1843858 [Cryptophyta sp. CCMP2293]
MDLPRRAPGVVSSEKQELLDAVRFGRKEPANPGEDGRQRWKFTHRAVVYIVNHSMSQEIVSWRIDGTDENIIPAMASDAETGTHVVLVVDASGSMRKDDVSGYPSRTSAVYDCLVKDFLTPQLQLLAGRGGGESSAIVTLIEMSDAATVIFEREPLYASLEGLFRQQMRTTARNHGNYLPGQEAREGQQEGHSVEVRRGLAVGQMLLAHYPTLFLIFMSDGAPSDHVGKECAHGIKVWSPVSSSRAGNGRFNREARPPLQVCAHGGATCRHSVKTDCEEKCRDQANPKL